MPNHALDCHGEATKHRWKEPKAQPCPEWSLSSWILSELQISKSHSDLSKQGSVLTQSTKALCGPAVPQGDSPSQPFLVVAGVPGAEETVGKLALARSWDQLYSLRSTAP